MRAIITGGNGQDARLLACLLRTKGWTVRAIIRPGSRPVDVQEETMVVDLIDEAQVRDCIQSFKPDHIYHLAACHHSSEQVGSADLDREMVRVNFQVAEILAAAVVALRPECRLLCAGSSQMFTAPSTGRLAIDEDSIARPSTFYGFTKNWSRELLAHYRDHRGLFGVTCILFNHESTLRPPRYISRKVSMAAAAAAVDSWMDLSINNIAAEVDWSDARDIVEGMYRSMTASVPADYILASGQTRTVEDLLNVAFEYVNRDWKSRVQVKRVAAAGALMGHIERASRRLRWSPTIRFDEMVHSMVAHDIELLTRRTGVFAP